MSPPICTRCGERPATSYATPICQVCLYAETMGTERAARQEAAAQAEREREKARKKAAKS